MILTVTMNPSVDISYPLTTLKLDDVNRVSEVSKTAGGKGLNVSRVLKLMQSTFTATGIVGGKLGEFIKIKLSEDAIPYHFYEIQQESRNSIAILHDGGQQTEILEAGPTIDLDEQKAFLHFYTELVEPNSTITFSGSLPGGIASDFYVKLVEIARQKNCQVLLDTSGEALKKSLEAKLKPTLIKPNETELADLIGEKVTLNDLENVKKALNLPLFDGVDWIVMSMGAAGALAKHGKHFYRVTIPKIEVVNPVGSGDAALAGLALGMDQKVSDEEMLKMGMTTGMLNTMEKKTGFINPDYFQRYFDQVEVSLI